MGFGGKDVAANAKPVAAVEHQDPEEVRKAEARARLAKSTYSLDGEHLCSADELGAKLAEELQAHCAAIGDFPAAKQFRYTFDGGIPHAARESLRLTEEGHVKLNQLTPAEQKPEWQKFLENLTGFFSLLLWAGSLLCFIGYGLRGDIDNLYLGIVLAVVVFVTGVFTYMQDAKSASLMAQFSKLMAQAIQVRTDKSLKPPRDGAEPEWIADGGAEFNPVHLVRGDIVMLKPGDKVPADCRVLEASDFKVDNSPLTGEPDALERGPKNTIKDEKEAKNVIFFGTDVKNGTCTAVVLRIGDDTFIGKIAQLTEATEEEETPIAKEIHRFIKIVSAVAIVLGVGFFIVGLALGADLITNLVFMIGIIVANVPEGLLATVTVSLTLTSKAMFSKNVLVKNMEGVETLGSTTAICSDKTGTLTQNKMTFAEVLYNKAIAGTDFVEGTGYPSINPADPTFVLFQQAMCLNTTAYFRRDDVIKRNAAGDAVMQNVNGQQVSVPAVPFYDKASASAVPSVNWRTQGDASESSIIKFAQYMYPGVYKGGAAMPSRSDEVNELYYADLMEVARKAAPAAPEGQIPFNSANKYHVKITRNVGNEEFPYTVWMKGAPERIMARCDHMIAAGENVPMSDEDLADITALQGELMRKGRRVLAFAKYDIPAAWVPANPKRKTIRMPKLDEAGAPVLDAKGEPVLVPTECDIPFEMDDSVRNFPMGDPTDMRETAIATFRTEAAADGMSAADIDARVEEQKRSMTKLTFIGMAALIDPPRPAVPDAVLSCQRAGIRVVMVTGDHPETAAAIAQMVNIFTTDKYKKVGPVKDGMDPCLRGVDSEGKVVDVSASRAIVVPGWELTPETSDEKWRYIFAHDEIVFARTSPQQKLQIVERFQLMEKEIVAVTGDGVNDAPALRKADIGVAMGIAGTEVSKSAADMILMDDNFASIVRGVEEGRLIFDNLKKSIAYTLSSNIPEITPFLAFITLQLPLPLSTVLILCVDLGTDMVPAISMAWENAESDIMRRPARDSSIDHLVTAKLVSFAYLQIGVIQALAGFFTWLVVLNDYGYPPAILPGLGAYDNWGKQTLFCKTEGGLQYGLNAAREAFKVDAPDSTTAEFATNFDNGYVYWDAGANGKVVACEFAAKNFKGGDGEVSGFDINNAATMGTGTRSITVPTLNSYRAMLQAGYYPFAPWRSVSSPFYNENWAAYPVVDSDVPGLGSSTDQVLVWSVQPPAMVVISSDASPDSADADATAAALDLAKASVAGANVDVYTGGALGAGSGSATPVTLKAGSEKLFEAVGTSGGFYQPAIGYQVGYDGVAAAIPTTASGAVVRGVGAAMQRGVDGTLRVNVMSRMMQKEALHHAQCAYFVSIVVVQYSDLLCTKTRWLSLYHQGLRNSAMNFALLFETLLAALLCYLPGVTDALGTRPLRLVHWAPGVPFAILIVAYDEIRKLIMRRTSTAHKQGEQIIMEYGTLARLTYW
jgi:sodium/potassium-transporting ATPase subunit alpha